jgi:hypothetical protein
MYRKLVERMGEGGRGDSVHAASWMAIEFQAAAALTLMLVLGARLVSPWLALPAFLLGALSLGGRQLTEAIFRENDSRFETLLFYFMASFALIMLSVGWSAWI